MSNAEPVGLATVAALAKALIDDGASGEAPAAAFFVPGRLEVLGKHTDYAGGRSLLGAVEWGMTVVVTPAGEERLDLMDVGRERRASLPLDPPSQAGTTAEDASGAARWTVYPATVVRRLAEDLGLRLEGARVAFTSDLPASAGMSSSSVLCISTFLALAWVHDLESHAGWRSTVAGPADLAAYLGAVEGGRAYGPWTGGTGVGTRGGCQDHTAILCAKPGRLFQARFGPTALEGEVEPPEGLCFAIAVSGVRAKKTGAARAAYNGLSERAWRALDAWRERSGRDAPHLGAALRAAPAGGAGLLATLEDAPDEIRSRVRQFVAETEEIVPAAGAALRAGDLATFGALVDRSQRLAEVDLGNQVPETSFLARAARQAGAVAASAFGAGFGGSVWALVDESRLETGWLEEWRRRYLERFPERRREARFLTSELGAAARRLV